MKRKKTEYTVTALNTDTNFLDKVAEVALKYAYELYTEYKIKQEVKTQDNKINY